MTFKAGDKVRYKDNLTYPEWDGWEGTVQQSNNYVTEAFTTKPAVDFGIGERVSLTTTNLELIEPVFTFADIQVGDKIRRTLTRPTGTTEVREGVVSDKDALYATDTDPGKTAATNYILAYDSDGHPDKPQVKLELLERPEPPHWTESKPVGALGVVSYGTSTKTLYKLGDDRWRVTYATTGNSYVQSNAYTERDWISPEQEATLTWIE